MKKVARMLREAGLKTPACHAFWGTLFDLGNCDEERRAESMKEHAKFLYQLAEMGVKTYTLHLGWKENVPREQFWKQISKSVEELLPAAEKTNICLALENISEPIEDICRLTEFVVGCAHPQVGLCFDTGHGNCYSPIGLYDMLSLMKKDIVTCHMHDNHGSFDDHNPPGDGNSDWSKMIPALKECPRMFHAETESGDWGETSWRKFRQVWEGVYHG